MKSFKIYFSFLLFLAFGAPSCFSMEKNKKEEKKEVKSATDQYCEVFLNYVGKADDEYDLLEFDPLFDPLEENHSMAVGMNHSMAVGMNHSMAVGMLAQDTKVNVNYQDQSGQSALHFAVKNKNQQMIKTLIQYQINPNLKTLSGQTPLDYAVMAKYKKAEIIKLLEECGAKRGKAISESSATS